MRNQHKTHGSRDEPTAALTGALDQILASAELAGEQFSRTVDLPGASRTIASAGRIESGWFR